jgi:hypothetical protein
MTDAAEPPTAQPNPADFPSAAAYLAGGKQQPGDYPNPADYPSAADYLAASSQQPTAQPFEYPNAISKPPSTQPAKPTDDDAAYRERMEGYARRTAAGVTFLAWVTGILLALSAIVGIIVAVQIVHLNTAINNSFNGGSSGICQSLGGTDPNC